MWTRRAFIKSGAVALLSTSLGGLPQFMTRAAEASNQAGTSRRKVLVSIFQRGAMDGLMAVPPVDASELEKARPTLFMPAASGLKAAGAVDLGVGFGLHPALSPFVPIFSEGHLAVVHGIGSPVPTRSHFDAQDFMENGTPGNRGTPSGWLNRAIGELGHDATPFRAVSLTKALPMILYGDEPALSVSHLRDLRIRVPGGKRAAASVGKGFEALYEQTTQELLRGAGRESFEALDMLKKIGIKDYRPEKGAVYPNSTLGQSLKQVAMLIKADVGLELAFTETGGWDTHSKQGTDSGTFARRARDLADSIAAFWLDVENYADDVVVLTMTEFGRTVRENGSGGTDHGRASCMFVLGGGIDGGRVYGSVPERLSPDALEDGRDLPVTTDFRELFSAVAGHQFGIADDEVLFPGWQGERIKIFKG